MCEHASVMSGGACQRRLPRQHVSPAAVRCACPRAQAAQGYACLHAREFQARSHTTCRARAETASPALSDGKCSAMRAHDTFAHTAFVPSCTCAEVFLTAAPIEERAQSTACHRKQAPFATSSSDLHARSTNASWTASSAPTSRCSNATAASALWLVRPRAPR